MVISSEVFIAAGESVGSKITSNWRARALKSSVISSESCVRDRVLRFEIVKVSVDSASRYILSASEDSSRIVPPKFNSLAIAVIGMS